MDPVSITGFSFGAVSLTFQLFSGCIKGKFLLVHTSLPTRYLICRNDSGYSLLSDAKGMPQRFQYLRVRLKTEQHRMLDWALVANLSEQDETLSPSLRLKQGFLHEVLREIEKLLYEFWNFDRQYKCLIDDSTIEPLNSNSSLKTYSPQPSRLSTTPPEFQDRFPHDKASLESKALKFIQKIRNYPARVRWAAFDHERFEKLLARLVPLNDFMKSLLDSDQRANLYQEQLQTSMQILQLNNKVDHLLQIVQAASIPLSSDMMALPENLQSLQINARSGALPSPANELHDSQQEDSLARLARFKALNSTIYSDRLDGEVAFALNFNSSAQGTLKARLNPIAFTILRSISIGLSQEIERSENLEGVLSTSSKESQNLLLFYKMKRSLKDSILRVVWGTSMTGRETNGKIASESSFAGPLESLQCSLWLRSSNCYRKISRLCRIV